MGKQLSYKESEELVKRALEGKQSEFVLLTNWAQAMTMLKLYQALKKIVRGLTKIRKNLYYEYLEILKKTCSSLETAVAIEQMDVCIDFYKKEAQIAFDTLDEFYVYFMVGNFKLGILAGEDRPNEDRYDIRNRRFN